MRKFESQARGRRIWKRIAFGTGVALLTLFALYVAVANIVLSTALFDRFVNGDPETLLVRYERGWTILPGRIHARNLSIRSSDSNVDFVLRLDRVEFDVSFLQIALHKKFSISRARGSGISFRARQKIEAPAATPAYNAFLPSIEGKGTLPIRPPGPPGPERWSDEAWRLWTIDLRDTVAEDVREIWIDHARFTGTSRIEGGFFLKPIREARIGPIRVSGAKGNLTVAEKPVLEGLEGSLDVAIESFDPRFVPLAKVLDRTVVGVDFHARCPDLKNLPASLVREIAPEGTLAIDRAKVVLTRGVLADGSVLALRLTGGRTEIGEHSAATDIDADALVTREGASNRLRFTVNASDVSVRHDTQPLALAPLVHVDGEAHDLVVERGFPDLKAVIDVPSATLPDARVINGYVPADTPVQLLDGEASTSAHLVVDRGAGRTSGHGTLRAKDLGVRVAQARIHGSAVVEASFGAFDQESKRLSDVHTRALVTDASIGSVRHAAPLVRVTNLSVESDAPVVDLEDPLREMNVAVHLKRASIAEEHFLDAYLPQARGMHVDVARARFDAEGKIVIHEHKAKGMLRAHAKKLGFSMKGLRIDADVAANAEVHDWDWTRGDLAIDDASVQIRNARMTSRANDAVVLEVHELRVTGKSGRFAFSDPLGALHASLTLAGTVRDGAAIEAFLPEDADFGFEIENGAFEARATADVAKHVARGRVEAHTRGIGVGRRAIGVRGDVDVTADVSRWDFDRHLLSLRASHVGLSNVAMRLREGVKDDIVADRLDVHFATDAFDLAHPSLRESDIRIVMPGAELRDARSLNGILQSDAVQFESGRARASVNVRVSSKTNEADGGAFVAVDDAVLRFGETRFSGRLEVAAPTRGFDAARGALDVSGARAILRDVRVVGAAKDTERWGAVVDVTRGSIAPGPAIDASFRADATDATPVLALVIGKKVPGFLADLVRAPQLHAEGHLSVHGDHLAFRDVVAHGGDIALRGGFATVGEKSRGGFVVVKGPFSAGIGIGEDGGVRLFNLGPWLAEKSRNAAALSSERRARK